MKFNPIAQTSLAVLSILLVPVSSFATTAPPAPAPYCIAVNGGFGSVDNGSTFVARSFSFPEQSKCTPWAGYTKTSATVIFTSSGTACLSTDGKELTVSVSGADPDFIGAGKLAVDYIKMSRTSDSDPFAGQDSGYLAGPAEPATCTADLLVLPANHD